MNKHHSGTNVLQKGGQMDKKGRPKKRPWKGRSTVELGKKILCMVRWNGYVVNVVNRWYNAGFRRNACHDILPCRVVSSPVVNGRQSLTRSGCQAIWSGWKILDKSLKLLKINDFGWFFVEKKFELRSAATTEPDLKNRAFLYFVFNCMQPSFQRLVLNSES